MSIRLEEVTDSTNLDRFVRLPWSIYAEDKNWIPPLLLERKEHLNKDKNPFFRHADAAFWLAYRGDNCVGRISAQVNHAHLKQHNDQTGHFGFLEAEDDAETFAALLDTVSAWLRDRGLARMCGPFSLSINDESGLLVRGFDTPPSFLMGHARPYYGPRLEEAGLIKAKDLISYQYETDRDPSDNIQNFLSKARAGQNVTIRPLDMTRLDEEFQTVIGIFNDAWSDNWGFVPFSEEEVRHVAKSIRPIMRGGFASIAEVDGQPAAMAISLPNVNEAIADLNGRLLWFGWAKLIWRLKVRSPKSGRVPLMGVKKQYQNSPLGAALAILVIDAIRQCHRQHGTKRAELSWVLEDNWPVRRLIESIGGEEYKTYRIYERPLA